MTNPDSHITCHASGDTCHGCDHYHGKADRCTYYAPPLDGTMMERMEKERLAEIDAMLPEWRKQKRYVFAHELLKALKAEREEVERLTESEKMFKRCFARIASLMGIGSMRELAERADNNGETYAEILTGMLEDMNPLKLQAKLKAVEAIKPFVMLDDRTFAVYYDELEDALK